MSYCDKSFTVYNYEYFFKFYIVIDDPANKRKEFEIIPFQFDGL